MTAGTENGTLVQSVPLLQHSLTLTLAYALFYGAVLVVGLLGNTFVVLAVLSHQQLRTTTDYLISSLAFADLLILLFCLPTTFLNSTVTEWLLGAFFCRLSTWINSTTSCASVYTLVAVTADRYLAICHTLKYTQWDSTYTLYVIAGIWVVSGFLGIPDLLSYEQVVWDMGPYTNKINLCVCMHDMRVKFIVVNLALICIVPFLLISVSYTRIFITVSTHRSLAIDAHMRDERVKLRVATMMLTVIVVFAICWVPLYTLFTYFHFFADVHSDLFAYASSVIRPLFQWLSILSSAINPLIYIAYSHKYRRAFHTILLLPCRSRYERVRGTILRNNERSAIGLSRTKSTVAAHEAGSEVLNATSAVLIESPSSQKRGKGSTC